MQNVTTLSIPTSTTNPSQSFLTASCKEICLPHPNSKSLFSTMQPQ